MRYEPLSSDFYQKKRQSFMAALNAKSLAVFNSNDIYPISADSTLPFAQHTDMLYLTGVDQEETILILFPDAADPKHREVLFLRETNPHIAVWEGAKLTREAARNLTGIETIYWVQDFERIFFEIFCTTQNDTLK